VLVGCEVAAAADDVVAMIASFSFLNCGSFIFDLN
jgi:hypothetical protein